MEGLKVVKESENRIALSFDSKFIMISMEESELKEEKTSKEQQSRGMNL